MAGGSARAGVAGVAGRVRSEARIECGDGLAGMLALDPRSVGLVLTDPPWGATQAAWDRPLDWRAWWTAIDHVLAPSGVVVVFASMRLAVEIAPLAPRPFLYDLVWTKNVGTGHLNANRAPMRGTRVDSRVRRIDVHAATLGRP